MQFLVGLVILALIANAMGIWFWIVVGVICIACAIGWFCEEGSLSEEEKIERRREKREEQHAMRMAVMEERRLERQLEIQAEHEKQQRKSTALHGIGTTVAKVAITAGIHALTGGKHRHRH